MPGMKKAALWAVGALTAILIAGIILPQTINEEIVKSKIAAVVRTKTGGTLDIGQVELSLPFSMTLHDMTFNDADRMNTLRLERLELKIIYWKLLLLRPTLRITAASGGEMACDLSTSLMLNQLHGVVYSSGFQLESAVERTGGSPLPFSAKLDGHADFSLPLSDPAGITGTASLLLNGISLAGSSSWVALLKSLVPKTAACALKAEDGRFSTTECAIATKMGQMELRAKAELAEPLDASPLEGAFVLRPTGSLADTVMALYPKYRKPDGAYYFPINGTLGAPGIDI
ncbi:MAG: type II secretion system protein GspN [Nitrospinae bacterium]|nr:type II secretion system protein GspN [Nitrospinota bacterium]